MANNTVTDTLAGWLRLVQGGHEDRACRDCQGFHSVAERQEPARPLPAGGEGEC